MSLQSVDASPIMVLFQAGKAGMQRRLTSHLMKSLWLFISLTLILILRIFTTIICIWVIISYLARLQFSDITFFSKVLVLCMKL